MKQPYDLLLFDFDGTLVDTVGDIAAYANSVLKDFGYGPCTVPQTMRAIGLGVHELFKGVAPELGRDSDRLEKAVELFKKRYREEPVVHSKAFPYIRDMLDGPLANVSKAIITNKPQDITLQILDTLDLRRYFKAVIGMHAGYPPKPDPASTLFLMRELGASASQTVYIGDSRVDAQTAVNAGIDFAWVEYGYDTVAEKTAFRFSDARGWKDLAR